MGPETRSVTPTLQPSPSDTSDTSDRTGSCDVTLPLPSNSATYTCTVTVNPGNTQSSSNNIQIMRPPPPELSCPSDPVPENSNVSCTCRTDNIGQPGGRLRWYTGTGNNVDTEVVSGVYDVNSVTMTWPVTRSDDVRKFRCVNNWAVNITSVNDFIVTVVSPPSQPTIHAPSTGYPFIAAVTQSATLTCDSSTPGRPAASYTWPVNHGGREGIDGSGRGTLTFDTFSKEHDGKTVSCRASNLYTANRRPVPDGSLTLEVYYHPELHLVPVTDTNQCQPLTSNPSYCLVTEGQSVHFRCQASSKPVAKIFTWQPGSGNSSDLYIQSANHTLHTRTYNCSVETGLGDHGNDPRLPLRNSMLLTVLVESIMKSPGEKQDSSLGVGAAVGVSVAVMVCIVVVFIVVFSVWLWRRHWVLPCAAATAREADDRLESRHVEPPQGSEHPDQGQSDDYEIQDIEGKTPSDYASLRTDNIGLRSVYSQITPTYINTGTAAEPGPVYENTGV
ncbi:uncharacterized protein, partial [Littorina saxatilis]|uniref:uncharacterized protein n=1 Tax=Littorina saxatilis TaxID=31220 RepID=UPI0038B45B81